MARYRTTPLKPGGLVKSGSPAATNFLGQIYKHLSDHPEIVEVDMDAVGVVEPELGATDKRRQALAIRYAIKHAEDPNVYDREMERLKGRTDEQVLGEYLSNFRPRKKKTSKDDPQGSLF